MKKHTSVEEHIHAFPKETQKLLQHIRQTIKKAAPAARETITYGIPTYKLNGNLVHFAGYAKHIGFYPGRAAIVHFKKELAKYKTSTGTVQFPLDKPIPYALVAKITKHRVAESRNISQKTKTTTHIHTHRDGSIYAKGNIKNGIPNGHWEWFRKDGTIMRSGQFKQGKQVGEWITYDKTGKIVKKTTMKEQP